MRLPLFLTASGLALAFLTGTAMADTVADDLERIGRDYCAASFQRKIGSFDITPYLGPLAAIDYPQESFCNCMGQQFSITGDDEMATWLNEEIIEDSDYFAMASFLSATAPDCLVAAEREAKTGGLGIDLGLDDDVLDGDLFDADFADGEAELDAALADNALPYDEGDVHSCQLAFEDSMLLPGFDPAAERARVKKAKQSVADVCTCAASYITALGDPFQKEVEEAMNPAVIYGSALAAGINICIDG